MSALADWRMWVILLGVGVAIVFYCRERFALELVSVVILCTTLVFFELFGREGDPGASELLAGFSNPALLTIMALLVIGQGIFHTGALDRPTRSLLAMFDVRPKLTVLVIFMLVFAVSAFLNNTPVVVMFIPILGALATRMGRSTGLFMMPLSFVCIFAGMTTLIGSSTNLLVSDSMLNATGGGLSFFEPAVPGLILSAVGMFYIAFVMPRLLPERAGGSEDKPSANGKQYIAQIEITSDHPMIGATPVAGMFTELSDITVRMVKRGEDSFLPPFDETALQSGDLIIIAATRQKLKELLSSRPEFVKGMLQSTDPTDITTPGERLALTEAMVSPGSRLNGRTVRQIGFRHSVGAIVLGVQRRSRMIRAHLGEIRLESGDVLLLFGGADAMRRLRADRDVLLMDWATSDLPDIRKASVARFILGALVLTVSTGMLPIVTASLIGAAAMIATRCLNIRQAARAFDLKLYLLIGSAFALGAAMDASGGASLLADVVVGVFAPLGVTALISALFLLVMALTNVLSNNATAILFTPIAITAADSVGADPHLFALTVLFAANTCFATPIGYQTNLLVMGPGKYRFADFVRAGAPLAVLIWITFTLYIAISL